MTLPRMYFLTDYWMKYPPAHLTLSGIVQAFGKGGKKHRETPIPLDKRGFPTIEVPKSVTQAAQMLGGAIHRVKGTPRKGWVQ